jgi:hypothetical protein
MLNYKLNAQGGFTPAAVAPPMRLLPQRCYVIIAQPGAAWGDRQCPLLHSYQHLEVHINGKGILQSQKKEFYKANFYEGGRIKIPPIFFFF